VAPSSPDLNSLEWAGLSRLTYRKLQPKPKTIDELKVALHADHIWEDLSQEHINMALANFTNRLTAYMAVAVSGCHF